MDYKRASRQLEAEEGRVPYVYRDSEGYWTIGVGHLVDPVRGGKISDKVIDILLADDIAEKWDEVLHRWPWAATLDDARQFVLLSMAFQMGIRGLAEFVNTLDAVEDRDYHRAANGMRNSKWAKQTPGRAERLAIQMETGEWVEKPGHFV